LRTSLKASFDLFACEHTEEEDGCVASLLKKIANAVEKN
jgi:hypothetical protein